MTYFRSKRSYLTANINKRTNSATESLIKIITTQATKIKYERKMKYARNETAQAINPFSIPITCADHSILSSRVQSSASILTSNSLKVPLYV